MLWYSVCDVVLCCGMCLVLFMLCIGLYLRGCCTVCGFGGIDYMLNWLLVGMM